MVQSSLLQVLSRDLRENVIYFPGADFSIIKKFALIWFAKDKSGASEAYHKSKLARKSNDEVSSSNITCFKLIKRMDLSGESDIQLVKQWGISRYCLRDRMKVEILNYKL